MTDPHAITVRALAIMVEQYVKHYGDGAKLPDSFLKKQLEAIPDSVFHQRLEREMSRVDHLTRWKKIF